MLICYSLALFVSAGLMFLVQPMFAKMVLPLLGGAPAVWNTEVVFFQAVLLLGYIYAHVTARVLGTRLQALSQCVLVLVPLLFLPIALPGTAGNRVEGNPVSWLLVLSAAALGLPFFVVTTISPMFQKWFSNTRHQRASDPYFLYASSNAGSLIGLLGYPLLVEPFVSVETQARLWSVGYLGLILLTWACACLALRFHRPANSADAAPGEERLQAPTFQKRFLWLAGAFIPASLMLSVTSYLSGNLAPVPLLWVIPLALYLLTLILSFSQRVWIPHSWVVRIFPGACLLLLMVLSVQATRPLGLMFALHLAAFFIVGMMCHGTVFQERPATPYLTEFYLVIALGGVLGGVFNTILAPQLFSSLVEYPLALVLVPCILLARDPRAGIGWRDWAYPLALGVLAVGITLGARQLFSPGPAARVTILAVPAVLCYLLSTRPLRFSLGMAALLLAGQLSGGEEGELLFRTRTFFGIHRVWIDTEQKYHLLSHGTTLHGRQSLEEERRCEPLAYYYPTGPLGQVVAAFQHLSGSWRIGVVGLGTGSVAAYQQQNQEWTFFEVDPMVVALARDPRFFTYLSGCSRDVRIVEGDARLSLSRAPDGRIHLLVLDAYNSDSIPTHLLTREALRVYLEKITSDGILLFHISNQYLDFEDVLGNLADDAGLFGLIQDDLRVSEEELSRGKEPSSWVVMSRAASDLGRLEHDPRWRPLSGNGGSVWTDGYSSLFSVLE